MFCREQVSQLRDDIHTWRRQGIELLIIGNGNAHFAEGFRADLGLDCPILIDHERTAYRAAELRRNVLGMMSPRLLSNAWRAFGSGARQAGVQGDALQLGGVFVFAPGGELKLAFRSKVAGDHLPAAQIEAALLDGAPLGIADPPPSLGDRVVDSMRDVLDLSPVLSFDRIGFRRHALGFVADDLNVELRGRRCLVTGANSGIGLATATALAERGAELVLLCRHQGRGLAAVESIRRETGNDAVSLVQLDITDLGAVEAAAQHLRAQPVDVLVHNAGVLPSERIETKDGLELTFATHVAGPHHLTRGLREALQAARGRVIWVSSGGMLTRKLNVDDPQWRARPYDGVVAYAETKRAQVVLAELWADRLAGMDVSVSSMHPGWADTPAVRTSLPRFHRATQAILRTPAEGADTVVWLAASPAARDVSGGFYFDRRAVKTHWLPSTRASAAERARLWDLVDGLTPCSSRASRSHAQEA